MDKKSMCVEPSFSSDIGEKEHNQPNMSLFLKEKPYSSEKGVKNIQSLEEFLFIEHRNLDKLNMKIKSSKDIEKLILYSNGLIEIPNLNKCMFLQVLCLADNNISTIQGLEDLYFLRELDLSKNNISFINRSIQKNSNLQTLYLSANPIKYVYNINNLVHVKSLQTVYFIDSLYGECPIAKEQFHYRLQIIHLLSSLQDLDGFPVTLQDRELEACFMNDYILECETKYVYLESKFKCKEITMIQSYLEEMETFNVLKKKNKKDFTNNESQLLESQQKIITMEIRNWKSRFSDLFKESNQRRLIQRTQCILEKESFDNLHFKLLDPDECELFSNVLKSFHCSSCVDNELIQSIVVSNVTYLGCQVQNRNDTSQKAKLQYEFYLLNYPFRVSSLPEWQEVLSCDFPFVHSQKLILTNCLTSCDSEYLKNVKKDCLRNSRAEPRIAILAGLRNEQNTLQQNKVSANTEGRENTTSCGEFHVNSDECVYYAVEFQYEFKDKYKLFRDMYLLKKEVKPLASELGESIVYHLSHIQQILTSVTLSACNISEVGNVTDIYVHVIHLDISYNELIVVSPLFTVFPNLRQLNVSHNSLPQLKTIKTIGSLEILDISWNKISSFFDLSKFISMYMKNLKCLNMQFNPITDVIHDDCQAQFIRGSLENLEKFNEIDLKYQIKNNCIEINDMLHANSNQLNSNYSELKNHNFIRKMGLKNKIVNVKTPQNLIIIKKDSLNSQKGVFVQPLASVDKVEINSNFAQWISITDSIVSNLTIGTLLSGLQELYLSHNRLQNINFDLNLIPNLSTLDISYNFLQSLNTFKNAKLNSLSYLNISGNFLNHINDIVHLNSIEQLYFAWNNIKEDLSVLREIKTLVKLKCIDITGNPLNNIHKINDFIAHTYPLIQYINGEAINFVNKTSTSQLNNITLDLPYLLRTYTGSELTNLTQLTMSNVSLKTIELNKSIAPNLTSVNLERNNIEYLSGLYDLPNLKTLRLSYNQVRGLHDVHMDLDENVKIFVKLEALFLDHNEISVLGSLHLNKYQNLKYLFLHANKIADLTGIQDTSKLRLLVLDKNEITQIPFTFFSNHTYLNQLYLESNKLQDLQFTRNICNLQRIFLGYNQIRDFSTLVNLKCLKLLREITLFGNNISRKSDYHSIVIRTLDHIQYLDGHNIQYSKLDQ